MTWTLFWDMHSGGGQKLDWSKIYIEADEEEAKAIFYNRFNRNPLRVTCTCCGEDYSISSEETLRELSAFHRNCDFAYMDKDGNEVDRSEAWVPGKGLKPGYTDKYVERAKQSEFCHFEHITLDDYLQSPEALFITSDQIKKSERKADIPDEGYVWV